MSWPPLPSSKYNRYDESRQGEEGRPHHLKIVYQHCQWKGLQTGGLLGLLISTPVLYFKGSRGKALVSRVAFFSGFGALIGGPAVVAMAFAMLKNQPAEAIFDRAYRLNHNQEQNRCDWFSLGTAATCGTAALVTKTPPGARGVFFACLTGFGLGVIFHVATKPIFDKSSTKAAA